ncbi:MULTISPECIES: RNA-binding protein [Actinosynnema]|uniref:RNA-binding protein n=1 Tax=Actinosynnema TaxID=40566 RepID=UPI0020A3E2A3|nr:RNA-binding protein [Actinosynnema pretiosum]MCP2096199.1 hypothetical protein [Actinosynnema pretiosum]
MTPPNRHSRRCGAPDDVHVHRVSEHDPVGRDERGHRSGDRGPAEAAHLEAVAAFARESGVDALEVRDPGARDLEALTESLGLPPGGYHDGAVVPLAVGLELVRTMLREEGAWCRLEAPGVFFTHVGYDQHVYVGTAGPCPAAVTRTRELGLFAEPIPDSPYDPCLTPPVTHDAADADFWTWLSGAGGLLEEQHLNNTARWHRVPAEAGALRAGLAPRALLRVWPGLDPDVPGVLAGVGEHGGVVEAVWEDAGGALRSRLLDETDYPALPALLSGARAARLIPGAVDARVPLRTAVLPDADGVVRARWPE